MVAVATRVAALRLQRRGVCLDLQHTERTSERDEQDATGYGLVHCSSFCPPTVFSAFVTELLLSKHSRFPPIVL